MGKLTEVLRAEITRLARREIKQSALSLASNVTALKRSVSKVLQALAVLERKLDGQTAALRALQTGQVVAEDLGAEDKQSRLSAGLLKKLRKRLKISQMELARLVGVSHPAVAAWEQGRAKPRESTRAAIIALRALSPAQIRAKLAGTARPRGRKKSKKTK
jgi:DNA-binding transcriptional regulator YiaG